VESGRNDYFCSLKNVIIKGIMTFKKGFIPWNKGRAWSQEARKKMGEARKGKGLGHTNGFTKGFIPWNKGKVWDDKTRQKISQAKKGTPAWNKGKPAPWASERNRKINPLRRGELAYHWKGGTYGTERHREMSRMEYKQWRMAVFTRDNFTCQGCQARGVYLNAHHIKPYAKFPELRLEVSNGVTLCEPCHNLITFSKNKQQN
jgi:5-methylcytosine-specific restriction endonuclease McrA